MKNYIYLFILILGLASNGCQKDPVNAQKEKSTQLVVPDGFNWKTTRDVTVTVKGLALPADYVSNLKISDNKGNTIFSGTYNLRNDITFRVTVPATEEKLSLAYGSRTIEGLIQDERIDFTFLQKDDRSDLEQ